MHNFIDSIITILIKFIDKIGYLGIFLGMFLESTIVPIPSEIIMIPAGIAASNGKVNFWLVNLFGISGNIAGAIFSYYIAKSIGRTIIFRFGRYFFVNPITIIKMENFFNKYGSISVLIGRLLPGFRHFISIPAGISKMDFKKFLIYTTIGSSIWTIILTVFGFFIGDNQNLLKEHSNAILMTTLLISLFMVILFWINKKIKNSFKKIKI
ncbi:MAG: DedA family protein [Rickettsiales bacterium]|jgi:membrane protein DedA with SNARE-associated domain|nr:DedA family protein [Rickettsiales bacterium]